MLFSKLYEFFKEALIIEESARKNFFIQKLDPRIKIIATFTGIICVSLIQGIILYFIILSATVFLAASGRINLKDFFLRGLTFIVFFTVIISLPLPFTTPGEIIAEANILGLNLTVTKQGVYAALNLVLRVWTALNLLNLLVMSTLFDKITAALSSMHAPRLLTVTFDLTLKYIFVLVHEAIRVSRAQEARRSWKPGFMERVKSVIPVTYNILLRSHLKANNIYHAMLARGFNGDYRSLNQLKIRRSDIIYFLLSTIFFTTIILIDRVLLPGLTFLTSI
ncbi:MAG: cobalt ECF transporter T component CbiQ [Candidatus Odinarchaeum yellowstonii]|uniref:Cobalt ECF transporter T component CbiQ n=1 Tax=Odinarchaeota yellowstonii (strain LCB_4) TaxID=1841599 RepID=A0AAF0D247_ODILC|nr:MAG: cobalt ECF transporter T component CbiQ [Candidatus Odinarchaeum yellowstonii]